MKSFDKIQFSREQCARELGDFKELLNQSTSISENEIKSFFKQARQLSAFLGTYAPNIGDADLLAYEFEIAGDFVADVVVGRRNWQFCMIELEDATPPGIFVKRTRNTTEWNRRFEHGFSQLVDWFFALHGQKNTDSFERDFGRGYVAFHGLLVLGRSEAMSEYDRKRLRWRSERVVVDSHRIDCVTYDELHNDLEQRLRRYLAARGNVESGEPPAQ